jgi:hypothetical protein
MCVRTAVCEDSSGGDLSVGGCLATYTCSSNMMVTSTGSTEDAATFSAKMSITAVSSQPCHHPPLATHKIFRQPDHHPPIVTHFPSQPTAIRRQHPLGVHVCKHTSIDFPHGESLHKLFP